MFGGVDYDGLSWASVRGIGKSRSQRQISKYIVSPSDCM